MIKYVAGIAILLAFGAGYKLHWYQVKTDQLDALVKANEQLAQITAERDKLQTEYNDVSKKLERNLSTMRVARRKQQIEVEKEYEKPVYSACIIPDSGVLAIKHRIEQRNTAVNP